VPLTNTRSAERRRASRRGVPGLVAESLVRCDLARVSRRWRGSTCFSWIFCDP